MKLYANAALSWSGRRRLCGLLVDQGWTVAAAAAAAVGVSVRCARKWVGRYRFEGRAGLVDRSSLAAAGCDKTAPERVEAIVKLRRLRFTAAEIAETLGMARSTVSGILRRPTQAFVTTTDLANAVFSGTYDVDITQISPM